MQRRLVILRHAKSAWPEGVADLDRPLAGRGRRDAPAAGRWLREHAIEVDLVVCSPALRAQQTWDLVAGELPGVPPVQDEPRLYGESVEGLLAVARELPDQARSVLFIGHNPDLEGLVALLTGTTATLKTSTVAVLAGQGDWAHVGEQWARLDTLTTPRGT
ncbi:MAG: SixA phosphatase family protein [Sciscionella sp.]